LHPILSRATLSRSFLPQQDLRRMIACAPGNLDPSNLASVLASLPRSSSVSSPSSRSSETPGTTAPASPAHRNPNRRWGIFSLLFLFFLWPPDPDRTVHSDDLTEGVWIDLDRADSF
jgi:hypothetical protein